VERDWRYSSPEVFAVHEPRFKSNGPVHVSLHPLAFDVAATVRRTGVPSGTFPPVNIHKTKRIYVERAAEGDNEADRLFSAAWAEEETAGAVAGLDQPAGQ
jgi:hypothetical protein